MRLLLVFALACGSTPDPVDDPVTVESETTAGSQTTQTPSAPLPASTRPAVAADATIDCGDVGSRPLGDEVSLLDGRLAMRPVQGATIEARPWDIMGAPEPTTSETRLFLEAGDEKVVVMVYELFATAGDDLVAQLQQVIADSALPTRLERVAAIGGGLEAYQVLPESLDTSSEAVFTYGLYVVSPDRTVQHLAFYVNPAAAEDGCIDLAMRSAATLRAGERTLDRSARTWELVSGVPNQNLKLALPAGYSVITQQGPDFWVHRIFPVTDFGQRGPSGLVYFGGHPSSFGPPNAETFDAPLLGEAATWRRWTDERGFHAEALRPVADHWMTHGSVAGANEAEVQALREAISGAQIAP